MKGKKKQKYRTEIREKLSGSAEGRMGRRERKEVYIEMEFVALVALTVWLPT